jgi:hypothetical protein
MGGVRKAIYWRRLKLAIMVVAIVRTTETYSTVHGRTDYFNQMFVAESHATIGFVPLSYVIDRRSNGELPMKAFSVS